MDASALARVQAYSRLALGAALAVAPGVVGGAWVGRDAGRPGGRALAAGMGGRDVAIAVGTLHALRTGEGAPPWVRAGMAGDVADLVATLRARHSLRTLAWPAVVALAGTSAGLGAWLQYRLD